MRGEAPKYTLFSANFAKIEAIGVDVLKPSNATVGNQSFEPQECRMVLEQMAHHEHTIAHFGALDHSGCILDAERQGFFDEHMLACVECSESHGGMRLGRCRNGDGIDVRTREHLFIGKGWQTQLVGVVLTAAQIGVDDTDKRAQLVVVPDQVASSEAAPDDGDSRRVGLAGRSRTSHG